MKLFVPAAVVAAAFFTFSWTLVGPTLIQEASSQDSQPNMSVYQINIGKTSDSQTVQQFRCKNANGLVMTLIDYGATMTEMSTPDKDGKMANIILKCDSVSGYEKCQSYFGCSVGRYCNRIAKGKFSIDGKEFSLATNNEPNHLHGGVKGFHRAVWKSEVIHRPNQGEVGVRFTHVSPDGDEGYPGKLTARVDYILNSNNELVVDFSATTDKATHCNLTNHNYWNMAGEGSGTILDHQLKVNADNFLAVDDTLIPTGEMKAVKGTELDFSNFKAIGKEIAALRKTPAKGYDHCFALKGYDGKSMVQACVLKDPNSGRMMEISTNQPGLQFYSGNFLDKSEGSGGYAENFALCLETQKYPDTPNQKNFPSTLLKPGETYHHKTVHKFSVTK